MDAELGACDVVVAVGTRPEVIKMAPVMRALRERGTSVALVHTGQHYSERLDDVFFEEMELAPPDVNLGVGSGSRGAQIAAVLDGMTGLLADAEPGTVLVQGDTNSTLGAALAAAAADVELGHVEAGLRSGNRSMPEELNRVLVDHAADLLFAPTDDAAANLRSEGVDGARVSVTGNTIVDAVLANREAAAERSGILAELDVEEDGFVLGTVHRAGNVDDPERFSRALDCLDAAASALDRPVVYPVHPRAADRMESFGIEAPASVVTTDPLGYLDFLRLEDCATLAVTDSGGVQEECCILGTPCITIRGETERPETVAVGANVVTGTDPEAVREQARSMAATDGDWTNPFGDGRASERIADAVVGAAPARSERQS